MKLVSLSGKEAVMSWINIPILMQATRNAQFSRQAEVQQMIRQRGELGSNDSEKGFCNSQKRVSKPG
jgi:hypothetical protein